MHQNGLNYPNVLFDIGYGLNSPQIPQSYHILSPLNKIKHLKPMSATLCEELKSSAGSGVTSDIRQGKLLDFGNFSIVLLLISLSMLD